ncbi:major facilitator superfamily domain-containing protein [Emericellopsis atlantica]|uniref:Major facilitator superfamily domain-containing protein n=1 Tax=Emericellopsis atlantica TaxID=2614577 RepID=A0A9P7ZDX6_9HYPO|nr:major facilitator superfamily domain-containing protein [Emericellopsis atlantica]KAG9250225.1 major facilitator superfamily domain-containing protein [Emericellopsis atlantica]
MGDADDKIRADGQDVSALAKADSDPEKATFTGEDEIVRRDVSLIVDWDGPDDPENPHNWTRKQKAVCITIVSVITFITPLASSIFAPSTEQVMAEFGSDSTLLASFIVSVYLIGYCFGPLVIAPLSEMYGRSPLYYVCNVIFVIFTVACALAPNMAALLVFRLLAGLVGSCPLTIGAGTLADMIGPEKRGMAMSWWICGPLLGPVIGPIAGGYLAENKGWRWSFWVVAMAAGVVTILSFIFLHESYAHALLEKKTRRLRKETGNSELRSALDTGKSSKEVFRVAIVRPTKMLFLSPIVSSLSLYMAVLYGYLYMLFTTFPSLFMYEYGFSEGNIGLTYLGIGIGSAIGLFINANVSDRVAIHMKTKRGGVHQPEYRLPPSMYACWLIPMGIFWFGWTADYHCHWILPILGTGVFGVGVVILMMSMAVYVVDAFDVYAASATAATTVLRSLLGALLPLGGRDLFDNLGMGWGSSLLGFLALAMTPLPFIFYRYGERLRKVTLFNVEF